MKTVRYLKGGKVKKMAKIYADILVKLGLVVYVDAPKEQKYFRQEIVQAVVKESPVIKESPATKDKSASFITKPKAADSKPKSAAKSKAK